MLFHVPNIKNSSLQCPYTSSLQSPYSSSLQCPCTSSLQCPCTSSLHAHIPLVYSTHVPLVYSAHIPLVYSAHVPLVYSAHVPLVYSAHIPLVYSAHVPLVYSAQVNIFPLFPSFRCPSHIFFSFFPYPIFFHFPVSILSHIPVFPHVPLSFSHVLPGPYVMVAPLRCCWNLCIINPIWFQTRGQGMLQITGINASLKITIYTLGGPGGSPPPSGIMERGGGWNLYRGAHIFNLEPWLSKHNDFLFCFISKLPKNP